MVAQAIVLALLVAVVGMPHGGLDHRWGRNILYPLCGRIWPLAFVGAYTTLMVLVLIGWWQLPLMTLACFVTLSAIHFGLADNPTGGLFRSLTEGGMIVWVPALFQPTELTQLLSWVVPQNKWPEGTLFDPSVRISLLLLLMLIIFTALWDLRRGGIRLLAFAALFALAPPLVSFIVYFCGWHSIRELVEMARRVDPMNVMRGLARVTLEATPLAALAVLLVTAGWWLSAGGGPLSPHLVQTVFVGLSVVAVPHMLLHWLADCRGVNPFAETAQ